MTTIETRRGLMRIGLLLTFSTVCQGESPPTTKLDFRLLTVPVAEARKVVEGFGSWKPKGLKYVGISQPEGPFKASPFEWCHVFYDSKGWRYCVNWQTGRLAACGDMDRVWALLGKDLFTLKESVSPDQVKEIALRFAGEVFPPKDRETWQVQDMDFSVTSEGTWRTDGRGCRRLCIVRCVQTRSLPSAMAARSLHTTNVLVDRKEGTVVELIKVSEPLPPADFNPVISLEAVKGRTPERVVALGPALWEKEKKTTFRGIDTLHLTSYRDHLGLTRVAWHAVVRADSWVETPGFASDPNRPSYSWNDHVLIDATTGALLFGHVLCDYSTEDRQRRFGNVPCTWAGGEMILALPCKKVGERAPYMAAQYLSSFGYAMKETPTDLEFSDQLEVRKGPPLRLCIKGASNEVEVARGELIEQPYLYDGVVYLHLRDFARLTGVRFGFNPKRGVDIRWQVPTD